MQAPEEHPAFVNTQTTNITAKSDRLAPYRLAVKDLFDIKNIPTSGGNPDWLASHAIPSGTNSCVRALIENGAQYIGKTLTDELAYSLNGLNMHYPTLQNPVTPARLPGGSSSGSAVAVAAGLADIGLGTDTGGSIRVPASYNSLFGLRTTHGRVPVDNMLALAPSFDTVGWMTQSLDAMLDVTQVVLSASPASDVHQKNASVLREHEDKPVKLMVLSNLFDNAEQSILARSWLASRECNLEHSRALDLDTFDVSATFRILQGFEIWQQHGAWIEQHRPKFASDIDDRLAWCKSISREQREAAQQQQTRIVNATLTLLDGIDALVIPTTPGRALLVDAPAQSMVQYREELMALTAIAGLSGLPQLHLPLFSVDDAPCGISLVGKKNSDLDLISLAQKLMPEVPTRAN